MTTEQKIQLLNIAIDIAKHSQDVTTGGYLSVEAVMEIYKKLKSEVA